MEIVSPSFPLMTRWGGIGFHPFPGRGVVELATPGDLVEGYDFFVSLFCSKIGISPPRVWAPRPQLLSESKVPPGVRIGFSPSGLASAGRFACATRSGLSLTRLTFPNCWVGPLFQANFDA